MLFSEVIKKFFCEGLGKQLTNFSGEIKSEFPDKIAEKDIPLIIEVFSGNNGNAVESLTIPIVKKLLSF